MLQQQRTLKKKAAASKNLAKSLKRKAADPPVGKVAKIHRDAVNISQDVIDSEWYIAVF